MEKRMLTHGVSFGTFDYEYIRIFLNTFPPCIYTIMQQAFSCPLHNSHASFSYSRNHNPDRENCMKIACILVISAVLILGNMALCMAEAEYIGIVKSVTRDAFFIRKGETIPAVANMKIMNKDVVRTGPDGAIGFILKDDTVISMGPGSEIVIDDFIFDPVQNNMSFIARMLHGTVSYFSGQIVKLSPESVRFETPSGNHRHERNTFSGQGRRKLERRPSPVDNGICIGFLMP